MYLTTERAYLGRLLEGSRKVLETTFLYGYASFIIFYVFKTRDMGCSRPSVGCVPEQPPFRGHGAQSSELPAKCQVIASPFHQRENQDTESQVRAQSHTADKWLSRDLNLDILPSQPEILTTIPCGSLKG